MKRIILAEYHSRIMQDIPRPRRYASLESAVAMSVNRLLLSGFPSDKIVLSHVPTGHELGVIMVKVQGNISVKWSNLEG